MPAPPARSFSASVPCGVNLSSNSPARYWRSNSLFSPTYDEIIFLIWRVCSSSPRPKPSTPALLEMAVRFLAPESRTAAISASGMPHRPKPPTASTCPSLITPSSAALALGKTLFTGNPSLFLPPCGRPALSAWLFRGCRERRQFRHVARIVLENDGGLEIGRDL